MLGKFQANRSADLWKRNDYRLQLVHKVLADWEANQVDVVLAPGHAMPAQPSGYPAYEI